MELQSKYPLDFIYKILIDAEWTQEELEDLDQDQLNQVEALLDKKMKELEPAHKAMNKVFSQLNETKARYLDVLDNICEEYGNPEESPMSNVLVYKLMNDATSRTMEIQDNFLDTIGPVNASIFQKVWAEKSSNLL
jgi:predicted transcriptional regulator